MLPNVWRGREEIHLVLTFYFLTCYAIHKYFIVLCTLYVIDSCKEKKNTKKVLVFILSDL